MPEVEGAKIDENYFGESDPKQTRANQIEHLGAQIDVLAATMPLQALLLSNIHYSFEVRLDKTRGWRPKNHVECGKELSVKITDVGWLRVHVQYISEKELVISSAEEHEEMQSRQVANSNIPVGRFGGLFAQGSPTS